MNRLVLLALASLLLIAVAKAAPAQSAPEGTALLQVRDDDVTSTEEEGGDAEESGDSVSIDSPVNKLMQQALTGKALTLDNGQPANTGTGPTIALGNKNTIIKETDGSGDDDGAGEQKIKKTQEASKKSAQEQLQKLSEEEANKEKAVLQEKERLEEKNKRNDDELHRKDEQHVKTSREEMAKANEGTTKQLESVQREHERIVAKNQRDEQLLKEKSRAAEAEEKKRSELARKKAAEDIEKKNKDHAEVLQKATAAAEAATKKAEAAAKENNQKAEATEKKAEQDKKAEETAKKNAIGNWCDCQSTRANFQSYGLWIQCPGDYLVTGIYRDYTNYLHGIYYFQCCRPCRPSNNQRLGLYNCQSANWWSSFDSQGWSYCPDNTYLQGVWKNSCDWIYCIEWAYCCGINGSRGRRECGTKDWSSSLDNAGWSTLDKNHFIQALYRSSSHYLSNIEHAQQCTWWPT